MEEEFTKSSEEHLAVWQESGLSQSEYCRQNGIAPSTFRNWKRKAEGKNRRPLLANEHGFVSLPLNVASKESFLEIGFGAEGDLILKIRPNAILRK